MQPNHDIVTDIVEKEKALQEAIKNLCVVEDTKEAIAKQLSIKKVEKAVLMADMAKLTQTLDGWESQIVKAKSNISVIRSELRQLNELKWRE